MHPNSSELSFQRTMAVSPERLWHLLTDGQMRELWGAPSDDTVLIMEVTDFTEGGYERHRCGPKEAPEFEIETRWYNIQAPDFACFTETLVLGGHRIFTSLVTYGLTPTENGTQLDVIVALSGISEEDMRGDVEEGWTAGLAKLEKLAAKEAA